MGQSCMSRSGHFILPLNHYFLLNFVVVFLFFQGNYYVQAPMIIFGSSSVAIGLIVVLLLPETLNKTQPQTIDDAERMHAPEHTIIVKKGNDART